MISIKGGRHGIKESSTGAVMEYRFFKGSAGRESVVAIQGAGINMTNWEQQLPLTDGYNLLCYRGGSFGEESAKYLLGLCSEFGLLIPHIIGHSMGAGTAVEFCKLANDSYLPSSVALITPVAYCTENIRRVRKIMIMLERLGDQKFDEYLRQSVLLKKGMPEWTQVEVCEGHFPFISSPEWFGPLYLEFIKDRATM